MPLFHVLFSILLFIMLLTLFVSCNRLLSLLNYSQHTLSISVIIDSQYLSHHSNTFPWFLVYFPILIRRSASPFPNDSASPFPNDSSSPFPNDSDYTVSQSNYIPIVIFVFLFLITSITTSPFSTQFVWTWFHLLVISLLFQVSYFYYDFLLCKNESCIPILVFILICLFLFFLDECLVSSPRYLSKNYPLTQIFFNY